MKKFSSDPKICPVKALLAWMKRAGRTNGPLFINTVSKRRLKAFFISKVMCGLINEAEPGKCSQGQDVRWTASSLAWTRGLSMSEIVERGFWSSSSTFIERYLSHRYGRGNALNT